MTDRLTATQFDKALKHFPRLSDTGQAAARSVLVDGNAQVKVADYLDISRQQVNRWVRAIKKAHLELQGAERKDNDRIKLSEELVAVKKKKSLEKFRTTPKS